VLHLFISNPDRRRPRHHPVLLSVVFHAVLLGFVISPVRPARYATVPRGVYETVHYTTLSLPVKEPGRARAARRAARGARVARPPRMERTPRMPEPPRVGALDLTFALSLVSTEPMVDIAIPEMVDTLRGDALAESPFASSNRGPRDTKGGHDGEDSLTFIAADVDRTAALAGVNPKPAYPQQLLNRGVEATFSVYFVVDTTGRIDTTTIQTPPSVDPRFIQAVHDVLVRWRFVPAEIRGRRVRQLMEQTFKFKIVSGQLARALGPIARDPRANDARG
jgi:TonB family protein